MCAFHRGFALYILSVSVPHVAIRGSTVLLWEKQDIFLDPQDYCTFQCHTLKISILMTIVISEVFSTSGVLPSTESTIYHGLPSIESCIAS